MKEMETSIVCGTEVEALIRPHLFHVAKYVSARSTQQAGVPLDANENALGTLAPEIDPELNRYPDPANRELKAKLGDYLAVPPGCLWVGNGSDEVLDVLIRCLLDPGEPVVVVSPSYGLYENRARACGAEVRLAPLDERFDLDVDSTMQLADGAKLVILCSPNNPTGNHLSTDRIVRLVEGCTGLVAVDEAYVEFSNRPSLACLARDIERLAVIRTFSKAWGLAGARVGYLVAHPGLVGAMTLVGLPYPLSRPSARAALSALEREREMLSWRERIIAERERVRARLEYLGIDVLPSEANFHLFFVSAPAEVQRTLAEQFGVLVRDRSSLPGLEGALRVTIGSQPENDAFLAALETLMASSVSDGK